MVNTRRPRCVRERIEEGSHVEPNTGCWIWRGLLDRKGYGRLHTGSATDGTGRMTFTHRAAYEAFVGPIPDGLVIDHLCRTSACCNPAHLEPVTQEENIRRSLGAPGRDWRSGITHCAKGHEFTPENTAARRGRAGRYCRQCNRDSARRYQRERRTQENET